MEIIDKRTGLTPEDMSYGHVYRVALDDGSTYIVMHAYNGNLTSSHYCVKQMLLTDLDDGAVFTVDYNEIVSIEELNVKLIIE